MKFIQPETKYKSGGHYSAGVISNGLLFISGQLPSDPDSGAIVAGDIIAQTKAVLANMERILTAAGLTRETVVQCRVYISDIKHWSEVNKVYADFFGAHKPGRVVVPSGELHYGALIELEAVAEVTPSSSAS